MYLHRGPFWWPCGRIEAICWSTLSNAAWPGLHWKPLDAAIRQLLIPRAINNNTMIKNTPTLLAVLMAIVMQWYDTARIAQWRRSMASLEATGHRHWVSICFNSINWSYLHCFFSIFHHQLVEQGHNVNWWPELTMGVWHIKLMRST